MSTIISDTGPAGNNAAAAPLILLLNGEPREIPPGQLRDEQFRQQIKRDCAAPSVIPVFVIENLLDWDDDDRWIILRLIAGIAGAHVQVAEDAPDSTDLSDAVLALMVGDENVERCGRGQRAAVEAAALVHAGDVQPAASRIATRLRELGVRGVNAGTIRREIRDLVTSLGRIANAGQPARRRVLEVFPGAQLPDLIVPDGWRCDAAGISRLNGDQPTLVMPVPVLITRRLMRIDDGSESVELVWPRDGQTKTTIVRRSVIAAPRAITDLADLGLPVTNNNAKDFIDYLHDFEAQNIALLPVGRITAKLGWVGPRGRDGFLWGQTLLQGDPAPEAGNASITFVGAAGGDQQIAAGYYAAGTFEGWQQAVGALANYPRVRFCMIAGLSTPLLEIFGVENSIVSLAGATSQGKTTALRASASQWGCPDERSQRATVIRTWDATRFFLSEAAAVQTSLPFHVDDTSRARKPEIIASILYDLCGGLGRGRGSPTGLRESPTWRTVMLMTGEASAMSFSEDGGIRARVLELWGSPFGQAGAATGQIVNAVNAGILEHFGHAGPAFVQFLIRNRQRWDGWRAYYQRICQRYQRRAGDDPVARRLAQHLAVFRMAEILARAARIYPWRSHNVIHELWPALMAEAPEADRAAAALRYANDWANSNVAEFFGCRDSTAHPPVHGYAGRWDAGPRGNQPWGWIGFFPHRLEEILRAGGFNAKAMIRLWHDRDWLRVDSDGRRQYRTWVDGRSVRLIAIERTAIEEVTGLVDEQPPLTLVRPAS